jgi:hypothetical protein
LFFSLGLARFWHRNRYNFLADRASPRNASVTIWADSLWENGVGLFTLSHYEEATDFFKRSIGANPEYPVAYMMLTASLALSGHDAEAGDTLRRYLALPLDIPRTIAQFKARQPNDTHYVRNY